MPYRHRLCFTGETQVNAKNRHGQTAVMKAVLYDDLGALKLLHKTGRWLRLGNRRKVRPLVVRTNHMTITANGMTQHVSALECVLPKSQCLMNRPAIKRM